MSHTAAPSRIMLLGVCLIICTLCPFLHFILGQSKLDYMLQQYLCFKATVIQLAFHQQSDRSSERVALCCVFN